MDATAAVAAFSIAALLMTLTPGLDTALVLRTAAVEGVRPAVAAGTGIVCGVLLWGLAASVGLGAVVAMSQTAYAVLQFAGAAWLAWLGLGLLRQAVAGRSGQSGRPAAEAAGLAGAADAPRAPNWFLRGLLTNALNPKVGVFYVSLLPQFLPADVPVVAFSVLLAAIHAAMGLVWFGALIVATRPLARWLRRPAVIRGLDGLTGLALLAFGLRIALVRPGAP